MNYIWQDELLKLLYIYSVHEQFVPKHFHVSTGLLPNLSVEFYNRLNFCRVYNTPENKSRKGCSKHSY